MRGDELSFGSCGLPDYRPGARHWNGAGDERQPLVVDCGVDRVRGRVRQDRVPAQKIPLSLRRTAASIIAASGEQIADDAAKERGASDTCPGVFAHVLVGSGAEITGSLGRPLLPILK